VRFIQEQRSGKDQGEKPGVNEIQAPKEQAHRNDNRQNDQGKIGGFFAGWPGHFAEFTDRLAKISLDEVWPFDGTCSFFVFLCHNKLLLCLLKTSKAHDPGDCANL
jgi:hypothetical protein